MNIPEIYSSAFLFREGKEYGLYDQRVDFLNAVFFERYVIDLLNIDSKFVHNSPQPLVFSNKDFMEWNNRQICTVLINRLPCGISLERPPKEKKKKIEQNCGYKNKSKKFVLIIRSEEKRCLDDMDLARIDIKPGEKGRDDRGIEVRIARRSRRYL